MTGAGDSLGVRPFAEIARGPVASVYKAYDPGAPRDGAGASAGAGAVVLLKALRPAAAADPERRARFAAEARLASEVEHPNIVRVLRVSPDALVAEWVEGRDLQTLLDERGALPPGLAAVVVREAARGLAAVHAAGIVHRDVKPANVLIGDDGTVRLTDFGLASLTADTADGAAGHEVRGTLSTLAPEIVRGDAAGPASDVFSLGAVLAHALTGRAPFDAATPSATLDAVLHTDAGAALAADPRVPEALARIAGAALHQDPDARPTADALADRLDALLGLDQGPDAVAVVLADAGAAPPQLIDTPPPPPTETTGATPRTRRSGPPRRRWVPLGLVAGIAATVVALVLLVRPDAAPPPPPEAATPVARDVGTARLDTDTSLPDADAAVQAPPDSLEPDPTPPAPLPIAEASQPDRAPPDRAPRAQSAPTRAEPIPTPAPSTRPLPAQAETVADTRPGTLVVAAEPWATVRVDGREVGTTPVRTTLAPGTYTVTFQNPGFPSHSRAVEVKPAETTRTELSMWSLVARVTLDVAPWAEVWVDGALWDTVPPQARPLVLTPGTHTLRFEHPTLGRQEQSLRVAAGESRTVRVRMTDSAP